MSPSRQIASGGGPSRRRRAFYRLTKETAVLVDNVRRFFEGERAAGRTRFLSNPVQGVRWTSARQGREANRVVWRCDLGTECARFFFFRGAGDRLQPEELSVDVKLVPGRSPYEAGGLLSCGQGNGDTHCNRLRLGRDDGIMIGCDCVLRCGGITKLAQRALCKSYYGEEWVSM